MDGRISNELSVMNATTNYKNGFKQEANVRVVPYIYQGWHYAVAYTIKKISAGEELLWDYGPDYWEDPEEKLAALVKSGKLKRTRQRHQAAPPYLTPAGRQRCSARLHNKKDD